MRDNRTTVVRRGNPSSSKSFLFVALASLVAGVTLACPRTAFATTPLSTPAGYVLQGRLTDSSGNPITAIVSLIIDIYSPDGTCLLYEENQSAIDLGPSNGNFAIVFGSNVGDPKRTVSDPGLTLTALFANNGTSLLSASTSCPSGYTPQPGDQRGIRISVINGGPPVPLAPDQAIAAVPYATVAETLQGLGPSSFIQTTTSVTQAALGTLTNGAASDASTLHNHDSLYVKLSSGASQNLGSGGFYTSGSAAIGTMTAAAGTEVQVATTSSATKGILIQGAANQSANLLELDDSAGLPVAQIDGAGNFSVLNASVAIAGTNVSSGAIDLTASYWTGVAAAADTWTLQNSLGAGSNPASTLTIAHTGSAGGGSVSIPGGKLGVGVANPAAALDVSGTTHLAGQVTINGSGTYSGTWAVSSDARFKKNIQTLDGALDKILALRGVSYELRCDEFPARKFPDGTQIGFIAQEVEQVVPEVVRTDDEGYKSVAYQNLTAVLVEAMKESHARAETLRKRNEALEAQVTALQAAFCASAAGAGAGICAARGAGPQNAAK